MAKEYLDYAGLKQYDEAIKAYILNYAGGGSGTEYDDSELRGYIEDLENVDDNILGTLNNLQELVGDTAVADQINTAIAALVNGAPEALDTLKEISDWITTHGEAASNLVGVVAEQGTAIADLNIKLDAISAISSTYIDALFLVPVELEEGQTVQDAINNLGAGEKLVLTDNVDEDLTIEQDAVIEANGVVFSGGITVNKDAAVTIIGATFEGEVTIA